MPAFVRALFIKSSTEVELSYCIKKESCLQDSPPAAGRFSDMLPLRRSAILSGAFFVS